MCDEWVIFLLICQNIHRVQGYQLNSVKQLQKPHPHTWQQAVVNLIILDMLHANQVHTKIDYTKGFSTFSYPQVQQQRVSDNLQQKFIESITDHIIADNWSRYFDINQYIFIALMSKQKVILGDMPEILLRQILGNTLTLQQTKDIFKFVLQNIRKNLQSQNGVGNLKNTMANVTYQLFSHVFLQPRDLYLTAILKKVMMAANSVVAFIGSPHFFPVQEYWKPPPYGVNFTQATKIPKRIVNQTPEDLIEKQAIFQILLDTRVWGEKYITNAFPYLVDDITLLSQKEHKHFKKMFFINYKKYEAFRDQVLPRGVVDQITSDFMATLPKGDQGLVIRDNRIN